MSQSRYHRRRGIQEETIELLGQRVPVEGGPIGRLVNTQDLRRTDWGREAVLDPNTNTTIPAQPQKLIKVTDVPRPVSLAVSAEPLDTGQSNNPQPVLKGLFGSGGTLHRFEVDMFPGSVLSIPGSNIDADATEEPLYTVLAGGNSYSRVFSNGRSMRVRASALPGENFFDARATRVFRLASAGIATAAGVAWEIPPFAKSFMLRGANPAVAYAATVSIFFSNAIVATNGTPGAGTDIESYTGPQLQTIRNAGFTVPVPAWANMVTFQDTAGGLGTFFLEFEIGL